MAKVQILIEYEAGRVTVSTPAINDKLFCYGALELAKDAIRSFQPEQPGIQTPPTALVGQLGAKNGR